jgi:hypothetical protein
MAAVRGDAAVVYTEVSEIAPAGVAMEALTAASRMEVFRPLSRQFNITGEGTTFNIPNTPAVAFAAVTEGDMGNIEDAFDPLATVATPLLYGVDVIVGLNSWVSAQLDPQSMVVKEVANALALHHDALAAALYARASNTAPDHLGIGTDGVELNFTALRTAQGLLYTANAPRRFAWVIHPTQWIELLKDNTFIDASVKGSPVLTNGLGANGYATSVLDVDIYVSDQIDESSGLHSMMFSKNHSVAYVYKTIATPYSGGASELVVDVFYNSGARAYEINSTYLGTMESGHGTAGTTNKHLVDYIS